MIDDSSDDQPSHSDTAPRPRKRLPPASRPSPKQATPAIETPDDSEGSDGYGGVRARLTKKQKRRFLSSGPNLTPSHAEGRFSTRRAGKVSNYNEDDHDGIFDQDDSKMLTPNYWATGEENHSGRSSNHYRSRYPT